jgi:uncharacterized protein
MNCPKCQSRLVPVSFGSIEVDRCEGCQGIWFDALEMRDLKQLDDSETVDQGDPSIGQRHDAQARVMCPIDNVRMVRMVDVGQPHIWLESCPVCYGVFLDAGEFTDLKEQTFAEYFHRRRRPRQF